jgi:alcohol dehydrogenase class IV
VHASLAELAYVVGVASALKTNQQNAIAFIQYIERLNEQLGIGKTFKGIIQDQDIPTLIHRALEEGNPLYPVPRVLEYEQLKKVYLVIKED